MKKMTYFVMALALVLGFTQCKKEQTPANNETEGVFITLDVNGGNNGSRVIVDPTGNNGEFNYATVTFEDGDVIYVGYKGAYVGSLTYSGGTFSGSVNISEGDYGQKLHFYFLGGKGFNANVNETDKTATVNISSQALKLPVISYAPSNDDFTGAGTYSAILMNKCSIMKFNVTKPAESISAVCISGMNNKVTVHFDTPNADDNGFSYSKDGSGQIMMKGGEGASIETWAIVLPQAALEAGDAGTAYIHDYEGTRPAINNNGGAIGSNQYISDATNRTIAIGSTRTGMLIGEFQIAADEYVHFSKGNLQAVGTTTSSSASGWTWSFATNQYDYIGNATANTSIDGNGSVSKNGTVDLFGWSTAATYYGINNNLYGDYSGDFVDWGGLTFGEYKPGPWRTLSYNEWSFLYNSRQTGVTVDGTENARYTYATINTDGTGVNGIILFPDSYAGPTSSTDGITFGTINGVSSWGTKCTTAGWATLESAGCVFLPSAGLREGTYVYDLGVYCWSSTDSGYNEATYVSFSEIEVVVANGYRYYGCSVRLVR